MDPELLVAVESGNIQKIIQLERREVPNIYDQTTPEGNTILHMAARIGHQQLVEEIVKRKPSLVKKRNRKGQTPVHTAARAGKHDVVKSFIQLEENSSSIHIAGTGDNYGNTPLHGAIRNGHKAVVEALAGHDKESLLLINRAGESPLSIAIDMRFTQIAKSIISLNKATLEFIGDNGKTALHYAVSRHDYGTMNVILERKPDFIRVQDEKKRTPLHYAAALGDHEMVKNLLEAEEVLLGKGPSVAYEKDNNQQIPLHLAAENGRERLIKLLLSRFPDTIEIVDSMQRNILHLAAKSGNFGVVPYILNLDVMGDLINSPDADGNTPLHLATINQFSDVVGFLSKNPKVDIKAINKSNKTALAIVNSSDDHGMDIQKHLTWKFLRNACKKRSINPEDILENTQSDDHVEAEKASKDGNKTGGEMTQIISVMSTLIATFTFTAAFTIPGGFKNDGIDVGMATLIHRSAFGAFVISDTIAMTTSTLAAVIAFWSATRRNTEAVMDTLPFAIGLTWVSLIAMSLAFVSGLVVVLQNKLWLAVLAGVLGCLAPFILYVVAPVLVLALERRISKTQRRNIVDDNPFLFIVRMIQIFASNITIVARNYLRSCVSFMSRKRSCCSCNHMC